MRYARPDFRTKSRLQGPRTSLSDCARYIKALRCDDFVSYRGWLFSVLISSSFYIHFPQTIDFYSRVTLVNRQGPKRTTKGSRIAYMKERDAERPCCCTCSTLAPFQDDDGTVGMRTQIGRCAASYEYLLRRQLVQRSPFFGCRIVGLTNVPTKAVPNLKNCKQLKTEVFIVRKY